MTLDYHDRSCSLHPMKTIRIRADADVLVSDEDYLKLWLHDSTMRGTWAARIQSHLGDGPLLEGRESKVRVALVMRDQPKELQLVA